MGAVKGRSQRTNARGEPTVLIQGRVVPQTREHAREAADSMGISMASYIELLIQNDAREHHVRPAGPFIQEALPVSA